MHNKKLKSSVAALALGAVLIGGTFAWFSSSDSVQNAFRTVGINPEGNKIEIYEKFDSTNADKTVAGSEVEKVVQVGNETEYNSLIRVKLDKYFVVDGKRVETVIEDGTKVSYAINSENQDKTKLNIVLDEANINYKLTNPDNTLEVGKWVENGEYYYYVGNVGPKGDQSGFTSAIIESVTLGSSVASDPAYKNVEFKVDVIATSVQSTPAAVVPSATDPSTTESAGEFVIDKNDKLLNKLKELAAVQNPNATHGNNAQLDGTTK